MNSGVIYIRYYLSRRRQERIDALSSPGRFGYLYVALSALLFAISGTASKFLFQRWRHPVSTCPDPDRARLGSPPGLACFRESVLPEDLRSEPPPLYPAGLRACGNHVHLLLRHQQDSGGGGDLAPVSVAGARCRLRSGVFRGTPLHGNPRGHCGLRPRLLSCRRGLYARPVEPEQGGNHRGTERGGIPGLLYAFERVGPPQLQALDGSFLCLAFLRGGLQHLCFRPSKG